MSSVKDGTMASGRTPQSAPAGSDHRMATLRVLTALADRQWMSERMGRGTAGKRDIDKALGFPNTITLRQYRDKYRRGGYAQAIVDKPVDASWRKPPRITDAAGTAGQFQKDVESLVKTRNLYHHFASVDRLSMTGTYGVLLMGFDDGLKFSDPVTRAKRLLYLRAYSELNAQITKDVTDKNDERFGLPELYTINMRNGSQAVHWSRLIHVPSKIFDDEVRGMPALEVVWNDLLGLQLVSGGSSEMFWRGAFPGLGIQMVKDGRIDEKDLPDWYEKIDRYLNDLERFIALEGASIQSLAIQVADPLNHVLVKIQAICAAIGMPMRIFLGSERGELAGDQDKREWSERTEERETKRCEPLILRPFLDRCIQVGVIAQPNNDYAVAWEPLYSQGPIEQATVGKTQAEGLAAWLMAGGDAAVPEEIGLRKYAGLTNEEIEEAKEILDKRGSDGRDEEIAAAKAAAEEQAAAAAAAATGA